MPNAPVDPAVAGGASVASVERFRRQVEALVNLSDNRRLGIAVSGGADSLALLALARQAFPERIEAATVDHQLRPESAGEAECVSTLCRRMGVPHRTLFVRVVPRRESLAAAARRARYAALGDWAKERSLSAVATGHQADDLAETLLMRLNRGSGVAGLSGIRLRIVLSAEIKLASPMEMRISTIDLIRPLLIYSRAELRKLVDHLDWPIVDDPANADARFDRSAARRAIVATPWLKPSRLVKSALALDAADFALRWTADRLWKERARLTHHRKPTWEFDPADIPDELLRRLIEQAMQQVLERSGPAKPRGGQVHELIAKLKAGRTSTLAGVLCKPGARWRFSLAPPRRGN